MATEDKSTLSSLLPQDQRGTDRLQNNQTEDTIKHLRDRGYKVTEEYSNTGQLSKVSGEHPQRKTWWDWLQLLIVPLLIAFLGIGFTWVQNQTSLQIAQDNRQKDIQLANDQQQEATLKAYLDDMSDLLLSHNLLNSKPGDEVRQVARERTLTILRRLKADRNRIVVQFLRDAHLIGGKNVVIELGLTPLELTANQMAQKLETDRHEAVMEIISRIDNQGGTSREASSRFSKGACLFGDLNGDALSHVDLSFVDLSTPCLEGTDLSGANLSFSHLSIAHLSIAHLSGANLEGADLAGADLSGAYLSGAYLGGTDLTGADLSGADLTGADLIGATGTTTEQLAKAKSLKGATMPDGSIHP